MCRNRIATRRESTMAERSRGAALTIFAILFALLAISDISKPLSHRPGIAFVFMGVRLTGTGNMIMGPLFGFLLLVFAYGIWTMRRYALPVAYIYTAWVIVNTVLFAMKHRGEPQPSLAFSLALTAIGIGVPLVTAVLLSRHQAELT
jgi:hypothetical protein